MLIVMQTHAKDDDFKVEERTKNPFTSGTLN